MSDKFNVLLECIANYNKQFSIYAKSHDDPNVLHNERTDLFIKMHTKHYNIDLIKMLNEKFNEKYKIQPITFCIEWCFKITFDKEYNNIFHINN